MTNAPSPYATLFEQADLPGKDIVWLDDARQKGIAQFAKTGFPTKAQEEWKYTSLAALASTPYPPITDDAHSITKEAIAPFMLPELSCYTFVFVNGIFDASLSDIDALKSQAVIHTLRAQTEDVQSWLHLEDTDESLVALNQAFVTDGLSLEVPENTTIDRPIHLVFVTSAQEKAIHSRHHIALQPNSQATILESHVSIENTPYWTNQVTTIEVSPHATLTHYTLQQESLEAHHTSMRTLTLKDSATYNHFSLQVGSLLARTTLDANLDGNDIHYNVQGAYLGKGKQHFDHYLPTYHAKAGSYSNQHYKGVLDDSAEGVFYGKIIVPPHTPKTDAHQLNKHLLLSEKAKAYSRPELDIRTDDVSCSHGSATGDIDHDALFYLKSRGIGEKDARNMLIEGFISEMFKDITPDPIQTFMQATLDRWLEA